MGNKSPTVGIVTVTFNSAEMLAAFFGSLEKQSYNNFTLYVIDNASSDKTCEFIDSYENAAVKLSVQKNDENLGVAEGNNQGIRNAIDDGCEYILLLNNDTEFGPGLISDLIDTAGNGSRKVVVPKIYRGETGKEIWYAGGRFAALRGFSGIHIGEGESDTGKFDSTTRTEYAPTCCMLVARDVFDEVGYMDSRYFVYYDDTDFCYRLRKIGISIWYMGGTVLYHKVGSLTGGRASPFSARMGVRNKIYFLRKNLPVVLAIWFEFAYFLYVYGRAFFGYDDVEISKIKKAAFREGMAMTVDEA